MSIEGVVPAVRHDGRILRGGMDSLSLSVLACLFKLRSDHVHRGRDLHGTTSNHAWSVEEHGSFSVLGTGPVARFHENLLGIWSVQCGLLFSQGP